MRRYTSQPVGVRPAAPSHQSLLIFRNANKEGFKAVLIGADRSSKAQANYLKKYKMPWIALKYQSPAANLLVKKMGVTGIPFLVFLAPDGSIMTKDDCGELGRSPDSRYPARLP